MLKKAWCDSKLAKKVLCLCVCVSVCDTLREGTLNCFRIWTHKCFLRDLALQLLQNLFLQQKKSPKSHQTYSSESNNCLSQSFTTFESETISNANIVLLHQNVENYKMRSKFSSIDWHPKKEMNSFWRKLVPCIWFPLFCVHIFVQKQKILTLRKTAFIATPSAFFSTWICCFSFLLLYDENCTSIFA